MSGNTDGDEPERWAPATLALHRTPGMTLAAAHVWTFVWVQTLGRPDWTLSYGQIAKGTNYSRSQVVRAVKLLVDTGWLSRESRMSRCGDRDASLIRCTLPPGISIRGVGAQMSRPGCTDEPTGVVADEPRVDAQMSRTSRDTYQESHAAESAHVDKRATRDGDERATTARNGGDPSPRPYPRQCSKHQDGDNDKPCRACGRAREAYEQQQANDAEGTRLRERLRSDVPMRLQYPDAEPGSQERAEVDAERERLLAQYVDEYRVDPEAYRLARAADRADERRHQDEAVAAARGTGRQVIENLRRSGEGAARAGGFACARLCVDLTGAQPSPARSLTERVFDRHA